VPGGSKRRQVKTVAGTWQAGEEQAPLPNTPAGVEYQDGNKHAGIQAVEGRGTGELVKALVWFWLIDETLSANLVYQSDYEIGSTTPSDEAMAKIMTMVMAW